MRPRVRRCALRGALLLAVALLAYTLARQWREVSRSIDRLTPTTMVLAGLVAFMSAGTAALAWRTLLGGLAAHLPLRAALRIYFVGQLGKYLPGSVWPVLAQMEMSKDYGVSRRQSGAASVIALGLAVPTAGVVAGALLPFSSQARLGRYGWAFIAVPIGFVVLHPGVLTRLLNNALRAARREPLPQTLTVRYVMSASGWMIAGFVGNGVATWLLARDLGATGGAGRLLLLCTGGFALAWVAGFLVVFMPAGAGVREAVLVLTLSPVLSTGAAALLAVVSRLLLTVADLLWGGVGAALRPRGQPRVDPEADLAVPAGELVDPAAKATDPDPGAGRPGVGPGAGRPGA